MTTFWKNRPFRFKDRNDYKCFIRSVVRRDGWKCRVPGCGRRSQLTVHHIIKRSLGGSDTLDNCITLCCECHRKNEDGKLKISGDSCNLKIEIRKENENDTAGSFLSGG